MQQEDSSATRRAGTINIAAVDDHPAVLEGLVSRMGRLGHRVVFTAGSGEEFIEGLPHHSDVDIAIVDLSLPGMDGWQVLEHLREERPEIRGIAFTISVDPDWVRRAIASGARAHVSKTTPLEQLGIILKEVVEKGIHYSDLVRASLAAPPPPMPHPWIDRATLPRREREFLEHLLRPGDATYKEIATLMGVSLFAVHGYFRYFNRHYGVHSRQALVKLALSGGGRPPPRTSELSRTIPGGKHNGTSRETTTRWLRPSGRPHPHFPSSSRQALAHISGPCPASSSPLATRACSCTPSGARASSRRKGSRAAPSVGSSC